MKNYLLKLRMNATKVVNNQNGFVMLTSYMLLCTVLATGMAFFTRGGIFIQSVERNQNKVVAFNMAEAGMDYALTQLAADPTYTGTSYTSLNSSYNTGGFAVTVTTPVDNANVRVISTTGYAPSNSTSSKAYESRSVTSYVEFEEQNRFDFGIFADDSVTMSGNAYTDSYDSSVAAYNASTAGSNGDVGTDATGAGVISLTGNATIGGDAIMGPDGNTTTGITTTGNAVVEGTKSAASSTRDYEPEAAVGTSLGSLRLSGNTTQTLAAGTYRYSSVSITGNARLNVTGAVTIYVDGAVSIAGNGIQNTTALPPSCLVYVTGSDNVSISGNGNFYGAIYAPNSAVSNTGNGAVYGAIVANTYTQSGNGAIHYDEALQEIGGGGSDTLEVKAWKENNTSNWGIGS